MVRRKMDIKDFVGWIFPLYFILVYFKLEENVDIKDL